MDRTCEGEGQAEYNFEHEFGSKIEVLAVRIA